MEAAVCKDKMLNNACSILYISAIEDSCPLLPMQITSFILGTSGNIEVSHMSHHDSATAHELPKDVCKP